MKMRYNCRAKVLPYVNMGKNGRNGGQVMAETAIIFPVLLFFILGIAQLALIINAYSIVNYAAFCACRSGIVHHANDNQMKMSASIACSPIAKNQISSVLRTSVKKEIIERPGTIRIANLRVTVTHYYKLSFPVIGRFFKLLWGGVNLAGVPYIPIRANCVMRMED